MSWNIKVFYLFIYFLFFFSLETVSLSFQVIEQIWEYYCLVSSYYSFYSIWVSWLLSISPCLLGRWFLKLFLTESVCLWRCDPVCSLILMPSHTHPSASLPPCGIFIRFVSVWATLEFKAFRQLIPMAPKCCIVRMKTVCVILVPADDDICEQRFKNRPQPQKQAVVEWGLTTSFIVA